MTRVNWKSIGYAILFAVLLVGGLAVSHTQTIQYAAVGIVTVAVLALAAVIGHFFGERQY